LNSRIFLVGNGPSLAQTDLSKLRNDYSFGMNLIHKIYPYTDWRPSFYMFSDHPQYIEHAEELIENHVTRGEYDVFLRNDVAEIVTGQYIPGFGKPANAVEELPPWVHTWDRCRRHIALNILDEDKIPRSFCDRFISERKFCKFGSGMNAMIQHAVDWGFETIIFIGTDVDYKVVEDESEGDPNHFIDTYHPAGYWDIERVSIHDATIRYAHQLFADWASENGIEVLNASGGNLEAYPRVEYEKLF